ncbi:DUF4329 domain-containing protein [Tateyamaria sp. SN6-1]|uniref:DUF4329 domain-containing protein n=1 Tax=Tateyamaria sp. SN6-1 TaxID=3092148 RepID=UPI0039F556CD
MKRLLVLITVLALSGCITPDPASITMEPRALPQNQREIAFMSNLFNDIQPRSIADGREYCGLIGVDANGSYVATEPVRGRQASCLPPDPRFVDFTVLASYHTHGAWHPDFLSEVPSFDDMRTDIEDGTDGYIATPGGRFWYVNARRQVARQICGRSCLVDDPGYQPDPDFDIRQTYTLNDLRAY